MSKRLIQKTWEVKKAKTKFSKNGNSMAKTPKFPKIKDIQMGKLANISKES